MTTSSPTREQMIEEAARAPAEDAEFEAQMTRLYTIAIDPDLQWLLARVLAQIEVLRTDAVALRQSLQLRAEAEGAQQTSVYDPMDAIAANARRVANSVQRGQRETTSAPVVTTTQLGGGVAEEPPPPWPETAKLRRALEKCKHALMTGQPVIVGDNVVYPLDGALVGNALNAAREALATPPPHRATRDEIAKLALDMLEGDEPGSVVNPSAEALAEYMPLADALLALLTPDPGWRPISEAPLGVPVLVFHMQHGYRVAACHLMSGGERNWTWGPGDEPIAWRPLPPPPAGEAGT